MASPSIPNSTRMSSAIRTIAWPSCKLRLRGLVAVLGTIDRICSDDDVGAHDLLNDWSYRLERVPDGHLDRLVADGRRDQVSARAGVRRRVAAEAAAGAVGRAVARRARRWRWRRRCPWARSASRRSDR